jgi:hypothetical protein
MGTHRSYIETTSHRHSPMEEAFTTMWTCILAGVPVKIFDNSCIGSSDPCSTKSCSLKLCIEFLSTRMETFQRTRVSASTCSNACFFSSLMSFLRVMTESVAAILIEKTRPGSSPSTKQLSSRSRSEFGFGCVTIKVINIMNGESDSRTHQVEPLSRCGHAFWQGRRGSREDFHQLCTGPSARFSTKSCFLDLSLKLLSMGMETFQRTRASASTCSNACFFLFLMVSYRMLTVLLLAISTVKTRRGL